MHHGPVRPLVLSVALVMAPPPVAWGDGTRSPAGASLSSPVTPVCNIAQEGAAACLAGRQCLCRREPGGAAPRWDCGILRPSCAEVPAGLAPAGAAMALFPHGTGPDWPPMEERAARRRRGPREE